jgi:hypothetical protein
VKDEDIVAIVAAILASDKPELPSDLFDRAAQLVLSARKHVAEMKRTSRLRIDYEVAAGQKEYRTA